MNTIQNYGSINFNENYNKQYTNFKSSRNLKPLSKKISSTLEKTQSKFSEKLIALYEKIFEQRIYKIEPAKSYEELHKILKSSIRLYKFTDFMDIHNLIYSLCIPKKMRTSKYNAKEVIDMGYNFAQKNKDKLDKLTYEVVKSTNTDYLKGILKAMEEWKTAK